MTTRRTIYFLADDLTNEGVGGIACSRHLLARLASRCEVQIVHLGHYSAWSRLRSQWVRSVAMNCLLAFHPFPKRALIFVDAAFARETCLALRVLKFYRKVRPIGIVHHFTFNVKPQGVMRALFRWCEFFYTNGLDAVFVNSLSTSNQVRGFLQRPVPVLRFHVPRRPHRRPTQQTRRQNQALRLLFVGSVDARKGVDDAIEAVLRYEGEQPITFRIVGHIAQWGGFQSRLAGLLAKDVQKRMVMLGHIDEAMLASEYSAADAFLFPSHWEGYGMAVEEAMAAGLPVLGYNVGAVPELVDESCGWLVRDGDITALTRAIEECSADEPLRKKKAESARRRADMIEAAREPMEKPFLDYLESVLL